MPISSPAAVYWIQPSLVALLLTALIRVLSPVATSTVELVLTPSSLKASGTSTANATVLGGEGNDTLEATGQYDYVSLLGSAGNDNIGSTGSSDDAINSTIYGSTGNDTINFAGGATSSRFGGEAGNDSLTIAEVSTLQQSLAELALTASASVAVKSPTPTSLVELATTLPTSVLLQPSTRVTSSTSVQLMEKTASTSAVSPPVSVSRPS